MARARRGKRRWPAQSFVWLFRATLLVVGGWLLYEAWRFPPVGELATRNPERTSFQNYRLQQAKAGGQPYRITQSWVELGAVAKHLRRAVLVAEDDRFYQHDGFDTEELKDAVEDHFERGEKLRGASTLSQQLAKNLWLSPERSLNRKLREAAYTWALERRLEKDRILELYLNVVEWGPGVFGAEAAARRYFGIAARNLDARQAALLAAALPAPLKRDPGHPSRALERRARMILGRMGRGEPGLVTGDRSPPRSSPEAQPTVAEAGSSATVIQALPETAAEPPVDLLVPPATAEPTADTREVP